MSLMNFLQLSSTTLLKILSWKNCCDNRPYHSCSCTMKLLWCGFLSCTSCPSLPRSFLPQVHYLLPPSAADSSCQYNCFTQLGRISWVLFCDEDLWKKRRIFNLWFAFLSSVAPWPLFRSSKTWDDVFFSFLVTPPSVWVWTRTAWFPPLPPPPSPFSRFQSPS